jgi:hypothetical protein
LPCWNRVGSIPISRSKVNFRENHHFSILSAIFYFNSGQNPGIGVDRYIPDFHSGVEEAVPSSRSNSNAPEALK